ncbi:MAG TPA: SRPBCC domain-containing protein [Alphaproteobacteria bacterium]|nr:SRPBCC domain-containing protein [Alphaproteobacteria bacterium]
MIIEKEFTVEAALGHVWDCIRDAAFVAPCVPGCQDVEELGDGAYRAAVKVGIGPIKKVFKLDIQVSEEAPPGFARIETRGQEGTNASRLTAKSDLTLSAAGEGATRVHYKSDVQIVGRLAKFGLGIMKKKAKALGAEFAENFRAAAEAGSPAAISGG